MIGSGRLVVRRCLSTSTWHPSTSCKELALPIALLTCKPWQQQRSLSPPWERWIDRFNKHGYSCLSILLDPPEGTLSALEDDLAHQLASSASPFPPLLLAQGYDTLIAQTYVSSRPLSGLILLDPPLTVAQAAVERPDLPLQHIQDFDYEPFFPIALLTTRAKAHTLETHRLRREYNEDVNLLVTATDDVTSMDAFERCKDWMDTNGL